MSKKNYFDDFDESAEQYNPFGPDPDDDLAEGVPQREEALPMFDDVELNADQLAALDAKREAGEIGDTMTPSQTMDEGRRIVDRTTEYSNQKHIPPQPPAIPTKQEKQKFNRQWKNRTSWATPQLFEFFRRLMFGPWPGELFGPLEDEKTTGSLLSQYLLKTGSNCVLGPPLHLQAVGLPIAKPRARLVANVKGGKLRRHAQNRAYTPDNGYFQYIADLRANFRVKVLGDMFADRRPAAHKPHPRGEVLFSGAVLMACEFVFPPTSSSRGDKHTKPDLDNILKSVCDALEGDVYYNDSQVAFLIACKRHEKDKESLGLTNVYLAELQTPDKFAPKKIKNLLGLE